MSGGGDVGILAVLIFVTAALYSSVGQAGATGYLAAMALVGLAPEVMKPTALVLNILVASIATLRFRRQTAPWTTSAPLLVGSVPLAFVGGGWQIADDRYRPLLGLILLVAAIYLARSATWPSAPGPRSVPPVTAALSGGGIGLLSGLTGAGGGVLLSPLLLFMGWAEPRGAASLAAVFNLVNSAAALAGNLASVQALPAAIPIWAVAAIAGAGVGTELGSRWLAPATLRRVLGAVLAVAGLKLLLP